MRLFIDANILVAVLNKEYPLFPYAARVLSLADNRRFKLYTSVLCLAIAYYFAEKKHGQALAKSKVATLLAHIDIADCGKKEATLAASNIAIHDFEDGLQYYAAFNSKCSCIVTNDLNDFYFSDIEVLGPEDFLKKHFNGNAL